MLHDYMYMYSTFRLVKQLRLSREEPAKLLFLAIDVLNSVMICSKLIYTHTHTHTHAHTHARTRTHACARTHTHTHTNEAMVKLGKIFQ